MTEAGKKYELVKSDTIDVFGRKLFRVRALVAIGLHVAAGDLGGYIEREENLSLSGNAWISGDARISGNAQISGDAWISGNAWISGDARISGDAWIYGNARISGNAWISGDARIYGNAQISGNARIYGNAQISGDAWIYGDARISGDVWIYGDARIYGDVWIYGDARISGDAWIYGNAQISGDAWISGDARIYSALLCATRSDGYTFTVAPTPDGPRIIAGCRYFTFDQATRHWKETRGGTKLGDESLSIVAHLKRMAKLNDFIKPVKDAS